MAACSSKIESFEDFVKVHSLLLAASGIPPSLHRQLFQKLSAEIFDGGSFFQVEACGEDPQRRLVFTADSMEKESQVFLIDHAWTFRLADARKQLLEIPGLAQRMASLMCVDLDLASNHEESSGELEELHEKDVTELLQREIHNAGGNSKSCAWLELEELDIDDEMLCSLDLSSKFPNLIALSLCGNKLQNAEAVVHEISKFKNLRALWLNENPIIRNCDDLTDSIVKRIPRLEIYCSRLTDNFGEWSLGFCGGIYGKDVPGCFDNASHALKSLISLDLSDRGIRSLTNKKFSSEKMPCLSHLNLRRNPMDQISANDLFKVLKEFNSLESLEVDIPGPLGKSAIEIFEALPQLSLLNGVNTSEILETGKHWIDSNLHPRFPQWDPDEPLADRVIGAMWLYLMTYRLADEEKFDETSVWYVMDELGSALRHSDKPNFRLTPFLYMPDGKLASAISFSIIWPTQKVHKGDECTRDFLFGIGEDKQRSARLTAWFHTPESYFIEAYEKHRQLLNSRKFASTSYNEPFKTTSLLQDSGRPLHVYTDIPQVEEFLTRSEFTITSDPRIADIIWTSMQVDEEVKKATGLTDKQYINQFPFEACLVMKHHLAETIQKAQGSPQWLQPTYNLETHLSQLIGDYYVRKRDGLDNLWILKPWNMARTIDTTVTSDLSAIIRLMETGPKICQKYIEQPALFKGKKFDLRYIVLLRSMNPLEIFLADVFWVRLANNQYSLDKSTLFEYETHFTVMNYIGRLNHMNIADFVVEFEKEHQVKWLEIHERIRKMIRAVFDSAASQYPEMHQSTSRAMYGVDVMLDCLFQPKLLEVTYCPDCTRACNYDTKVVVGNEEGETVKGRDFYNLVFGCLFLNETKHVTPL